MPRQSVLRLLGVCLQPCVLATSRSPLDLPGESVVSVAPLALPKWVTIRSTLPRWPSSASAAATPASRSWETDTDTDATVELCRRLDGLPLALEIAAARTGTMTISEISDRLGDNVDVLDRPRSRRPAPPRCRDHRSMVVRPSRTGAGTLARGPRCVRRSVHRGRRTRTVAGADDTFDPDLDELVYALTRRRRHLRCRDRALRLLDIVRRFALGRPRRVMASWMPTAASSITCSPGRGRPRRCGELWRPGLLKDLVASYDDVAEALRWCIDHDDTPRRAHQLCSSLWGIVHQGHADDINDLMRRLIARFPDFDTTGGAQARAVLATSSYVTGDPAAAIEIAGATLAGHPGPISRRSRCAAFSARGPQRAR